MKIETFYSKDTQMAQIGRAKWSVARLFQLTKDFPVMEIPLDHLDVSDKYENLSLRQMVMHMKAIQSANLKYPIILDEDGELMDGRHRIMKAMLKGIKTVKAVRFDENPLACEIVNL